MKNFKLVKTSRDTLQSVSFKLFTNIKHCIMKVIHINLHMGHIDELCLGIKNFKKLFETFFMDTSTVKASDHLPPFPEMSNIG